MKLRILRSADYKKVPWKNGRGTTSEILISPNNAQFPQDPFDWRLSSALIQEPGEFSTFPGYDRTLLLVEGRELLLHSENPSKLIKLSEGDVYSFAGEAQIRAEITCGPVKDLNLIYRRRIKSNFKTIHLSKKDQKIPMKGLNLIYVVQGSIVLPENGQNVAATGDTVFIEGKKHLLHLQANESEAWVVLIGIEIP